MTTKQIVNSLMAPDGSQYVTLTDGAGNLVSAGGALTVGTSAITGGGSGYVLFDNSSGNLGADSGFIYPGSGGPIVATSGGYAWSNASATGDVFALRDAAQVIGIYGGPAGGTQTAATSLRIYNTASGGLSGGQPVNNERIEIGFAHHSNIAAIDVLANGTGTLRNFGIYVGGVLKLDYNITNSAIFTFLNGVNANGSAVTAGNFISSSSHGWIGRAGSGPSITDNGDVNTFQFIGAGTAIVNIPANNQWQFGAANAASPVAQTISFQGASSGGTSGVNATIVGSLSYGNAGGTSSGDLIFQTGIKAASANATATTALTIKGETQSVVLNNAALSTSANDGFLYIATCAGTPTGTPTTFTGRIAMIYDTTNHQFWFYDGGWKQPKTAGGAALVTWQ